MRAVLILVLVAGASASLSVASARDATKLSPISRVVDLMKKMRDKVENDGKQEEKLYDQFMCWATTVINTKTASNTDATSKIDELTQYIDDISSGRVEFTSERGDLTKELATLNKEIEDADAMREKEKADFEQAEDEMTKAITALDKAVEVLTEATKEKSAGAFLSLRAGEAASQSLGFSDRVKESQTLLQAVELGEKFLAKGDALFLRRLLTGDVPKADWKKLNRKAGFKMKYKARSGKIADMMAKMLETFEQNLKDAKTTEKTAQESYDKLMTTKKDQRDAAEKALSSGEKEKAAREEAKSEAQAEVDALTEQVTLDTKWIEQTTKDAATKKEEWKDRKSLRAGEIEAVSKAIGILTSDEARDLFRSGGNFFFIQESAKVSSRFGIVRREASAVVKEVARKTKDRRLALLATKMVTRGHFDEVLSSIDEMISTLKKEEESDIEQKETCEKDRMTDARTAAKTSRTIDELSDTISKLEADIADIIQAIADKNDTIKRITKEMAEATEQRKQEKLEFERSTDDDANAKKLVLMAKDTLEGFYKDAGLTLMQKDAQAPPPPPPQTFDEPYGGASGESAGITTMMDIIAEDIQKDIDTANKAEKEAVAEYGEAKTEFEEQTKELLTDIEALDGEKGDKMQEVEDTKADRKTQKGELDAVMETMTDALPSCNFIAINFDMRLKNRQVEIDGLDKAKGILKGAAFGL